MTEAVFLHSARMGGRPIQSPRRPPGETLVDLAAVGMHYDKDGSIGSAIIHEQFVPVPARPLVSPASE